jgi:ribonuclease HI
VVEYEALIFRVLTAQSLGIHELLVKGDSQLIIKQVQGPVVYEPHHEVVLS